MLQYSTIEELRDIAEEAGVLRLSRKKEETILKELEEAGINVERIQEPVEKTAEIVEETEDEKPSQSQEDLGQQDEDLTEASEGPSIEPTDDVEDEEEVQNIEDVILKLNREIQYHRDQIQRLQLEVGKASKMRQSLTQVDLAVCIKEFQESMRTSEAIKKAQERASLTRHAHRVAERRERLKGQ